MRGRNNDEPDLFCYVQLEDMIPADHVLRKIRDEIDFSFIDDLTETHYSKKGRPSVSPHVLVKMLLIGYLYGINSERRLCQEVHLNLAYRWFCDLSLNDKVPDHSTFSKNRHGRFSGTNLFRDMFYKIVEQAIEKGLVKGKHLSTDATLIAADAAMSSLEPFDPPIDYESYWNDLNEDESETEKEAKEEESKGSINETHYSKTDADAQVASRWGSKKKLSYSNNILMDNKNRVIVDVEVTTPSNTDEALSSVKMLKRSIFRHKLEVEDIGADSVYSRGEAASGFMETGVKLYSPERRSSIYSTEGIFSQSDFVYKEDEDVFVCPNGQELRRTKGATVKRAHRYAARKKICENCPIKRQCTRGQYRSLTVHIDREALDWVESLRHTNAYVVSQKMRKRIEHLFGEAKEQMGLRRAQRRGFKNMEEQCLMTAMAQNIKRIIFSTSTSPRKSLYLTKYLIFKAIEASRLLSETDKSYTKNKLNITSIL